MYLIQNRGLPSPLRQEVEMGLGSVQVQAYILQGVVHVHGNSYDKTVYKWSVRTVTENNKSTRIIGLPGEDNRMSVQGRL